MSSFLRVEKISATYGKALVLQDISFHLQAGDSLALLGRNGVGKTSLLKTLLGLTHQKTGDIFLKNTSLTRLRPYQRAHLGLGWVPQERNIFHSLSVEEHLTTFLRPPSSASSHPWTLERLYAFFPLLKERRSLPGRSLSGGEQQMLALARALALNPSLLLLDEPLEGLSPPQAHHILYLLTHLIHTEGLSVILVEQNPSKILPLTHQALVLEKGQSVYQGPSPALLQDPDRLKALLGFGACA